MLKNLRISLILVATAIFLIGAYPYFKAPDKTEPLLAPTSESSMLYLVNWERVTRGITPLVESPILTKTATIKAYDMCDRDYFAHIDSEGVSFRNYLDDIGYERKISGENLIKYSHTNIDSMKLLMESEGHRNNILQPLFEEFGLGECEEFIVQHFGLPD